MAIILMDKAVQDLRMTAPIERTIAQLLTSLAKNEDDVSLLLDICALYIELDNLGAAQHYLDKAKKINPVGCLEQEGLLYFYQGCLDHAEDCFITALQHKDTPVLRYNLGALYFVMSDFIKAWDILSPLLNNEPTLETQLLSSRVLYRKYEHNAALELLKKALIEAPDDTDGLGLMSLIYLDLNDPDSAKQFSDRTLSLDAHNFDASVVSVMLRLITRETSVVEIEELLAINPEDERLLFALANTHMTQGSPELAEAIFQQITDQIPDFYDCYIALAWCQLLNNKINAARETYQNAIECDDNEVDGWGGLALICALSIDYSKARQLIDRAQEMDPTCFLTEMASTVCYYHLNPTEDKNDLNTMLNREDITLNDKLTLLIQEIQARR